MLPSERLRMDIDDVVDGPLGIERFTDDFVNQKILSGLVYNHALKTDLFNDDVAYLEIERSSFGYKERVFVGSDGNVIGAVADDKHNLEFMVVKADQENPLYEYAAHVGKDLGVDFKNNEAQGHVGEIILRSQKELGYESFEDWFKDKFAVHKDQFTCIDYDQFVEVYENSQACFEFAVEEILEQGLFDPSVSKEELRDEFGRINDFIVEVLNHPEAGKALEAFGIDGVAMVEYDVDYLEFQIAESTVETPEIELDKPALKARNKLKT